jgi:hypothetical protein
MQVYTPSWIESQIIYEELRDIPTEQSLLFLLPGGKPILTASMDKAARTWAPFHIPPPEIP